MGHDTHCHDLAELFLSEEKNVTEKEVWDLAETIQGAIEDWLADRESAAAVAAGTGEV